MTTKWDSLEYLLTLNVPVLVSSGDVWFHCTIASDMKNNQLVTLLVL